MDQVTRAETFAGLHVKGNPVIIYNAWDAGSAKAIMSAGAEAIATGDHPVGLAHGYTDDDFDEFTFETYLGTIKEISSRTGDVPFSVDISNGEGLDEAELRQRIRILLDAGVVGINFEDRADESGLRSIEDQAWRIAAIRSEAVEYGVQLFINARSDLFAQAAGDQHARLLDEAVARADAYSKAGANGFFTPGLMDLDLIHQLAERTALPLNIIRLPGAPGTADLRAAGVSRISFGPVGQMEMIEWLKDRAGEVLAGND